jgi:hypothetical protein
LVYANIVYFIALAQFTHFVMVDFPHEKTAIVNINEFDALQHKEFYE